MISRTGLSEKGFTLIELTVVTIIMGIMIALAFPSFSGVFARTGLKSAVRELSALLFYARRAAIMERLNYRVFYDLDQGRYWFEVEKDPFSPGQYSRIPTSFGKIRSLPKGIVIKNITTFRGCKETGQEHTTFYPNGRTEGAILHLQNKNLEIFTITARRSGQVESFDHEVTEGGQ